MTPVPFSAPEDVKAWMQDVMERLQNLENPQGPTLVWSCTSAALPSAATYVGRVLRVTDLNILAHSDGTNWRRQDTGAAI